MIVLVMSVSVVMDGSCRYIILGLLFLVIVRRRSKILAKELDAEDETALYQNTPPEHVEGLPRYYGIFYAIG